MKEAKKIRKSRKKLWVLFNAKHYHGMDQGHEGAYAVILAVCKTERQARRLRDQNPEEFGRASIDSVRLYE